MKELDCDRIYEILDSISDEDFVEVNNNYCDAVAQTPKIYPMTSFDDVLRNESPTEIALKVQNGNFSIYHQWFVFDGYDNLISSYTPQALVVINDIVDYIVDYNESLGCNEIQEYINECKGDDEE